MIQNHAPTRLTKLEFRRVEGQLRRELKQAEHALKDELAALEADASPTEVLHGHETVFGPNNEWLSGCQARLSELRSCAQTLDDRGDTFASLESQLLAMGRRVDDMAARLRVLPETWAFVDGALRQLDAWLSEVSSHSLRLFDSHLASFGEYKRAIDTLTVNTLG